jgi:hypothetical protein
MWSIFYISKQQWSLSFNVSVAGDNQSINSSQPGAQILFCIVFQEQAKWREPDETKMKSDIQQVVTLLQHSTYWYPWNEGCPAGNIFFMLFLRGSKQFSCLWCNQNEMEQKSYFITRDTLWWNDHFHLQ